MQSLDLDVLQRALEWRRTGRKVWLVTVTQTFGASPRPPGSLMAMRDDGILLGSVSGGCIEDDLVTRRAEYAGRAPQFASYGVTSEKAQPQTGWAFAFARDEGPFLLARGLD